MPKKVITFVLLISCMTLLIGCNEVKDLTDEETRLIAEYAATSLLKYDLVYTDRIADGDREALEKDKTEESVATEVAESSEETVKTEESKTEEASSMESSTEDSEKGKNVDNKIDEEESSVGNEQDIAKIVGAENISITYKDYLIDKQYPAKDKDGELIYLDASEGYQLLVIRFKVKNNTEEKADISLFDKEMEYTILCNGNKAANPMLTILLDDLTTLDTTLNPSEETEAVLVFQISDNMKDNIQTIELKVHYNDIDNKIKILR